MSRYNEGLWLFYLPVLSTEWKQEKEFLFLHVKQRL